MIWADQSIVAVNACWNARPNALAIVAVLDQALAARKSILHSLAFALIKDSRPSTFTTGHWLVIFVLGKPISKTVTDQDRLQVDVALLV